MELFAAKPAGQDAEQVFEVKYVAPVQEVQLVRVREHVAQPVQTVQVFPTSKYALVTQDVQFVAVFTLVRHGAVQAAQPLGVLL